MTTTPGIRALLARHRLALAGTLAVLAVGAAAAVVVLRGDDGETSTAPPPEVEEEEEEVVAPLTGLGGDFGERLGRPALFVKYDNVEAARPQSGLAEADIVLEEQVEGNLTRLAAVFHSTDADPVGPVRSTRTTDLELVGLFGTPLFASSGGNAGVLAHLAEADVIDIGANISGEGFYRSDDRPAPHNLYSSTQALYDKAPESSPPPEAVFAYLDEGEPLPAGAVPAGGVALSFGGPQTSSFAWDEASGTWLRNQGGTPHVDAGGRQLAPTNVVVLAVDYDMSGQEGRSIPHGRLTGQGQALVLTQGHAIEGTWARPGLGDPLTLTGTGGEPIELTPGQTFVELPPPGGWSLT